MKIVIGNKDGKSYQVEIPKETESLLMGKRIGDEIEGNAVGVPGFTFQITGGSDLSGFPMRHDVDGSGKKKILMSKGVGFKKKKNVGERRKKMIHGNQIAQDIHQINVKITKEGPTPISEILGKKEEKPAEN